MTASYVLVTAAVVVLVEVVAAVIAAAWADLGADRATQVQRLASATANQVMQQSATLGRLPTASQLDSTRPCRGCSPGLAREPADETGGGPPDLLQRQRGAPRRGGGAAASARRAGGGQLRPGPLPGRQAAGRPATRPCPPRSPAGRPPHGANATA